MRSHLPLTHKRLKRRYALDVWHNALAPQIVVLK